MGRRAGQPDDERKRMSVEKKLLRFGHEAMNTRFEVLLHQEEESYARRVAQAIFDEIDRLEGLLSRFVATSEIAMIGRLRPGEWLTVGRDAYECLAIARQAWQATDGWFDPTVGPLMDYWRRRRDGPAPPDPAALDRARARVGMDRLLFAVYGDQPGRAPTPGEPHHYAIGVGPIDDADDEGDGNDGSLAAGADGVGLDLGAIGKGYALDKALETLEDWGVVSALLSAGGSTVLAVGAGPPSPDPTRPEDEGWWLGIGGLHAGEGDPRRTRLRDLAMSGSGIEAQGEHVLDPRLGRSARRAIQAWAIGPSATFCDAFSTAMLMMEPEAIERLCREQVGYSACVAYERERIAPEIVTMGEF
jgi:thiamine biosynthesis lipoprotein